MFLAFAFFLWHGKVSPGDLINIESIGVLCNIACSDKSIYDYCDVLMVVNDGKNEKFEETCYGLATKEDYSNRSYGIFYCSEINCKLQ